MRTQKSNTTRTTQFINEEVKHAAFQPLAPSGMESIKAK